MVCRQRIRLATLADGGARAKIDGTIESATNRMSGRKWEASVARCLPYRWNPLLLPGGVQPRFCPDNV